MTSSRMSAMVSSAAWWVVDVSAGGFGLSRSMLGRHLAVNPLPAAWLNSRSSTTLTWPMIRAVRRRW